MDTYFYVPLLETLKTLLSCEDILYEMLNPHNAGNEHYSDFCNGSHFKTHPLFSADPYALQVVGYYDELEIVNPIGSYVKKQKLGCCFFVLANVRPQYRSTLKAISLVSVAKHQDIVMYGIDTFLSPFVEDLKTLYCDGISVTILGEQRTFYGALLAFLADTLAAHFVGGFQQSMSFTLRVCRSCLATTDDLPNLMSDRDCHMRTPETHFEQCLLLSSPLRDHYSTSFGINRMSKLEEVPGYSVVHGLPHDLMHDIFEGVFPYEFCNSMKYFSIAQLNLRISRYDFSSTRPSDFDAKILRTNAKIHQSASQMMSLCHEFPILVGDLIPESDANWKSFLVLIKICNIALSPTCNPDTVAYLRVLIEEKLSLFKHLYPGENVIPKQHYLVHYPSQIEKFGPLLQSWTMLHESKLSFVKRVSVKSNYKNVSKTVAKRHQFWVCFQMHRGRSFLQPSVEVSPKIDTVLFVTEPENSSHFCKGVYVLLTYDVIHPRFGKVFDLVKYEETVLLCVQEYYGSLFSAQYNSFILASHGCVSVVPLHTLNDHRPLRARESFDPSDQSLYITLPYYY